MNHPAAALRLVNIHKHFDGVGVLQGVHLEVPAGAHIALIGPNGAGKSTLFDIISGGQAPDSGRILLNGQNITGCKPWHIRRLGLARGFQASSHFARMSVADNLRCAMMWQHGGLSLWRRLAAMPSLNARVSELLQTLQLRHCARQPAGTLDHAAQRRLELGLCVAADASVLLLDEPTAGLRHDERQHMLQLIRQFAHGKTLILTEHDTGVVAALAQRVAVLAQGRILAFDTLHSIRANEQVRRLYLG